MKNSEIQLTPELLTKMTGLYRDDDEFFIVSLVTIDGFLIKAYALKRLQAEADKLAAMSSTICAMSNSSAKELVDEEFKISTIETDKSNLLFVRTNYLGMPCVLMTAAWTGKTTLANARYKTVQLAQVISNLTK